MFFYLFIIKLWSAGWKQIESKNFIIIYNADENTYVTHILNSAEQSFNRLSVLFRYSPKEKIVINLFDYSDYGSAAATTLPMNYIRLEIEPLEPGYENTPYTERFEWLLNHELVHIFVNDFASNSENFCRSVFQKVVPEKENPLTVFYSLFTSSARYSPRWHQEAIAVFFETWLSGGFGRITGSFEEMYFRSLIFENRKMVDWEKLETYAENKNFLIGSLYYLYGTRFITYLAINYDLTKIIDWYTDAPGKFFSNFSSKFEATFGMSLDSAWGKYCQFEKNFQIENIEKLEKEKLTELNPIQNVNPGWISRPVYDKNSKSVIFATLRVNELAEIIKVNTETSICSKLITLPTPSKYLVSSIAYDSDNENLFFTTNNNNLYRDIYSLDIRTGKKKLLFENCRIGNLSYSQKTKELWGIKHEDGRALLVRSEYPYRKFFTLIVFDATDEIQHLAISPSGKYLAAVVHRPDGSQFLSLGNCRDLSKSFRYIKISDAGSPEFPSWSDDEKSVFWNSYINGVSNIYRYDLETEKSIALTHTLRGLFHPVKISSDSLFAFEFTSEGFVPVKFNVEKADKLPAIKYMGEKIIEKTPDILSLGEKETSGNVNHSLQNEYSGLSNLNITSFVPLISGFKEKVVFSLFTKFNDPLLYHNLSIEIGAAKRNEISVHFHLKYEYKSRYGIELAHNAPDFYDLFNTRKKGLSGNSIRLFNKHYWQYDHPHKITQETEAIYYQGITSLNDNLIKVDVPDLLYLQTKYNSTNLRKTIGSSDYESGTEFNAYAISYSGNEKHFPTVWGGFSDISIYNLWLLDHNVGIINLSAGAVSENKNLGFAKFYFGGFGNREVENEPVKQYRKTFSFPGNPVYSIPSSMFIKLSFENNFPPVRFYDISFFSHFLSHLDYSIFSQLLLSDIKKNERFGNLGIQINLIFEHWFNLESTFSAGYATSWFRNKRSDEWMVSFKLLKN